MPLIRVPLLVIVGALSGTRATYDCSALEDGLRCKGTLLQRSVASSAAACLQLCEGSLEVGGNCCAYNSDMERCDLRGGDSISGSHSAGLCSSGSFTVSPSTASATAAPTLVPTTKQPTPMPTSAPTTAAPSVPGDTRGPTLLPTTAPPSLSPTPVPTIAPTTTKPSPGPVSAPIADSSTVAPSLLPTFSGTPSRSPSVANPPTVGGGGSSSLTGDDGDGIGKEPKGSGKGGSGALVVSVVVVLVIMLLVVVSIIFWRRRQHQASLDKEPLQQSLPIVSAKKPLPPPPPPLPPLRQSGERDRLALMGQQVAVQNEEVAPPPGFSESDKDLTQVSMS